MKAIIGLGNPGPRYRSTRHNVGHMVIDELARRAGGSLAAHRSGTHVLTGYLPQAQADSRFLLAISDGYMNVSGPPVASLCRYYKIEPPDVLVIHDDLDLPQHELRLKAGGGEGGHNGLKSLTGALGSKNYQRLRIGIGRPPGRMDPADYVLAEIRGAERDNYDVTTAKAADVVEDVLVSGFSAAQARLHTGS